MLKLRQKKKKIYYTLNIHKWYRLLINKLLKSQNPLFFLRFHIGILETKRNVHNEIPRPHFHYRPSLVLLPLTAEKGSIFVFYYL